MRAIARAAARAGAVLALALSAFAPRAQLLDSLVMPGKLAEAHAKLESQCESCHKRFDKGAQRRLCLDCHKDVAADVTAGRGYHGRAPEAKGKDCRTCHTDHKGREAKMVRLDEAHFDHAQTDFPLREGHAKPGIECKSCHVAGKRHREAPGECVACHRKDDAHKGGLGTKCAECHTEKGWKAVAFDHARTRFALAGKHAQAKCAACHEKGYKDTARECVACHRKDDAHKGSFGPKCESCHGVEGGWKQLRFDHDRDTRFPLRAKHKAARCDSCHKGGLFKEPLPRGCIGCHKADDAHKGTLGEDCAKCHDERGWKGAKFDHDRDTHFPLRGKHKAAKCESCHKPGAPRGKLPTACFACHEEQDAHAGLYGEKCEKCHGDADWKEIRFDHDRDTKYPLTGRHRQAKCASCHKGPLYQTRMKTECAACHGKDDPHKGQLGQRCDECHKTEGWKGAPFDHARARFPLLGSHLKVPCKACHLDTKYRETPRECAGCHDKDDVHEQRLGKDCKSCHNARSWASWDFDHARRTPYPLAGAHRKAKCVACHAQPAKGKVTAPTACYSCHRADDTHGGAFGAQCERCHGPESWKALRAGARVAPARQ